MYTQTLVICSRFFLNNVATKLDPYRVPVHEAQLKILCIYLILMQFIQSEMGCFSSYHFKTTTCLNMTILGI